MTNGPASPVRVLVLSPVGDLYGSSRSILEALDRIDAAAVEPAWAIPTRGELSAELRTRGVPVAIVPELRLLRASDSPSTQVSKLALGLPRASSKIARLIRANSIDVVHSNSAAVLAGAYGSRLAGRPHLWYIRELIPASSPFAPLLKHAIRARSDEVFCVSSAVAAQLQLAATPTKVVHSGIDWGRLEMVPRFDARELFNLPQEALVVGSSGYLNPRKGMDLLLEAYASVRDQTDRPTRLMLAGAPFPGNEDFLHELLRRADDLGLANELVVPGYLDQIAPFLGAIDIFALATREPEGLGRAVLEAMASGLPVVATGKGGMVDIVDDQVTGILVDGPTVEEVADALGQLISDQSLRERLGVRARESVTDRFRLEHTAAQLSASYLRLGRS